MSEVCGCQQAVRDCRVLPPRDTPVAQCGEAPQPSQHCREPNAAATSPSALLGSPGAGYPVAAGWLGDGGVVAGCAFREGFLPSVCSRIVGKTSAVPD